MKRDNWLPLARKLDWEPPLHRDRIEVAVSDDGVGLPIAVDLLAPRSLGLDLVSTLTQQLDADVVVERDHGTAFRFTFARTG